MQHGNRKYFLFRYLPLGKRCSQCNLYVGLDRADNRTIVLYRLRFVRLPRYGNTGNGFGQFKILRYRGFAISACIADAEFFKRVFYGCFIVVAAHRNGKRLLSLGALVGKRCRKPYRFILFLTGNLSCYLTVGCINNAEYVSFVRLPRYACFCNAVNRFRQRYIGFRFGRKCNSGKQFIYIEYAVFRVHDNRKAFFFLQSCLCYRCR